MASVVDAMCNVTSELKMDKHCVLLVSDVVIRADNSAHRRIRLLNSTEWIFIWISDF